MIYLRQSTASQEVLLGPFVDATDGNTAETGLTIANTDIKVWKTGATTLANKNSGGATHISAGNYYAVFDATDTDTLGSGAIVVQVAGALAVRHAFTVLPGQVYDSLVLGTDLLDVNTSQAGGTAWASGAITAASLAADAGTELADAVHDEVVEGTTTLRQMMRGFAAVLMGKASGLATTTAVYRDVGDTKDRITATVDADGNRSVVTRDLT